MALVRYTNEFSRLKRVALYRPRVDEIYQDVPGDVMYTSTPDPVKVLQEFDNIVNKFRELIIDVVVLEDKESKFENCPNMIFLRDTAAVIQDKIVLARMKYAIRKHEPEKLRKLLCEQDPSYNEHLLSILENESMEGADILVANSNEVFAYTGSRSSLAATNKICRVFGLNVINISGNIQNIPQHLLGAMHVLSSNLIVRRPKYCSQKINGFKYIDLEETEEVVSGFAMNIVTVSQNVVIMPDNCPNTKQELQRAGITCYEVPVREIQKMGGGLACMTLPLERDCR